MPCKRTLLLLFGSILFSYLLLEIFCYIKIKSDPYFAPSQFSRSLYTLDEGAFHPRKDIQVIDEKRWGDVLIYRATYRTDRFGRRTTGFESSTRDQYALFFGCSYTFGQGLNEDETLAHRFGTIAPQFRPYNYGMNGAGPNYMLKTLQDMGGADKPSEKGGFLIYLFADFHVRRAAGSHNGPNDKAQLPSYQLKDGQLEYRGSFRSAAPGLHLLYDILGSSYLIRYLNLDWLKRPSDSDVDLASRIVQEAYETYRKKFGNDNFYVLLYPRSSQKYGLVLRKRLDPYGIRFLDYSSRTMKSIPWERHPNGEQNQDLASWINNDI